MTILGKRNYKRAGAVTIGFAGLLLASIAVAYPGDNDKDGWNDDGDKDGWNDDGDKDGWNDDDDRGKDDERGEDDDDDGKGGKGKGKNDRDPRFEDEGDSLKAELELRNLKKNQRVRAELEASAEVEIECRSKKGGKGKGKGKDKDFEKELDIELEGVEFFSKNEIKGNRLEIEVETEEAEDALDDKYGHDGGCPKGYDRRIKEVSFLDAKLEIEQGKKEVVTWLCTFDDPTEDGRIRERDVDCHRL